MDDIRAMFMRQSMRDCEEVFSDTVQHRGVAAWDYIVVTAANEAQATAYRAQIDMRLDCGLLPRQTVYSVIPDPDGKRVGSGGATLNVLREIARVEGDAEPFARKKILVLHSGGDSRRIPQYSACGKLFAHVPRALRDGRASTLFDEFCISLSCVPSRMNGGMLVMSGDVLLLFNALQIDLERVGAACLSIKAPVSIGARHGVFLPGENGFVRKFLHKQSEKSLLEQGAVNAHGLVDIDTGAIWLDEARVHSLYGLVRDSVEAYDRFVNDRIRLSFYQDFVYPMASEATLAEYLSESAENIPSDELADCRRALFQTIGGSGIALIRLSPAEFLHFGTSEEWRALMETGEDLYPFLGWSRAVMSAGSASHFAAINSVVDAGATIGAGSALENSRIGEHAKIGSGCIVSGADFDGVLPDDTALSVLSVDGGSAYCARYYGVQDNPKESLRFGKPIASPLWDAPLHPVRASIREAVQAALAFETDRCVSLANSFARASMHDMLLDQRKLTDQVSASRVIARLAAGESNADVLPTLAGGGGRQALVEFAKTSKFPLKARIYHLLTEASGDTDFEEACWQSVNDHLLAHTDIPDGARVAFARDEASVSLPVRVNFGGGWSDTPPYCLEFGGTVLNASVLLGGQKPVRALAKRIDAPVIRIQSDDLGVSKEYTRFEHLHTGDPGDPHALCKAALLVCGATRGDARGDLRDWLSDIGGGILIRTSVIGVPKGSGLGTSSILSAATVRALAQLFGQPNDDAHIASLTLLAEQVMSTGGGWQDQIGGLLPGIKLTSSRCGTPQRMTWRTIQMPSEAFRELSDRFALIYTGQRRLARNILRDIMGKVIARNPETLRILSEIQRLAVLMAFELETGNIDAFTQLLTEHWALSKQLDAGSSNTCIDHMIAICEDLLDGCMIAGAGGGGFLSVIMKKGVLREALSDRLDAVFQDSGVKVWDAAIG